MLSLAVIDTSPASPCPNVLVTTDPPLVRNKESVVIAISPAFPLTFSPIRLATALGREKLLLLVFEASPSTKMLSLAVIDTSPAFPRFSGLVLIRPPLVKDREPVAIVTLPAFPSALRPLPLLTLLIEPSEASPSTRMLSLAVIDTSPASPSPSVLALIRPPIERDREPVVIVTFPAFPTALPLLTRLVIPLEKFDALPLIVTVSVAVISTEPASPLPKVLASTNPLLVKDKEPVVIVTFPAFPTASIATRLLVTLLSTVILAVALMIIFPA